MATRTTLPSFPAGGCAVIVGASGAIGAALVGLLRECASFAAVVPFSRDGARSLDLSDESSIEAAARQVADIGSPVRLVIVATGFLHGDGSMPEKSFRQLDADRMAHAFAVNAVGPALVMKHVLPLLPRAGKSVFATLSARVGSIGDNRLGGWYSYRASKAALNQIVHTAAIELARGRPHAICVALHPGTVESPLSAPFAKSGLDVSTSGDAASRLLRVIDTLTPLASGGFFDHRGETIPW